MADRIVISGVRPWDGEYPFDVEGQPFTTREWGWIKRLSGYLPLTIEDGIADPELVTVFAVICLRRAGKVEARDVPEVFERLSDAPFGSAITLETDRAETEDDAGPPAINSPESDDTSGRDSKTNSETSPQTPTASGTPDSATSEWPPVRSAS